MKTGRFKSAIFDMDGTLIDSMGIWKDIAEESFKENGLDVPAEFEHKIFSMTFSQSAEYCIKMADLDIEPDDLVAEWNYKALEYYNTDIPLKPYAVEFIEYLRGLGMTISLTTSNFYDVAKSLLERKGISELFDSLTSTQEVTRSKLYPDVFLLSSERLGTQPSGCIVFEDSYTSVIGAKRAGMYVVGVFDKYAAFAEDMIRYKSDRYILSFSELLNDDAFFA